MYTFILHHILTLFWIICIGTLKAKIAKLKSELINGPGGKSSGTKNAERGFDVTKSGDTRIGLVGFPVSICLKSSVYSFLVGVILIILPCILLDCIILNYQTLSSS